MKKILQMIAVILFLTLYTNSNATTIHIVKKGDTLDKIAKKYNVSVKSIIDENSTPSNKLMSNKLKIAMKIKIPDAKPRSNTTTTTRSSNNDTKYHIVKRGETLQSIADKYSISITELKVLNNIKTSQVKKGTKLLVKQQLPSIYIVNEGDTLEMIAAKFNKTIEDLLMINELDENTTLTHGQKIYLSSEPIDTDIAIAATLEKITPQQKINNVKNYSKSEDISELSIQDRLILFAKKMLHIPYKFGGNGIWGIDCSGFVKKVYEIAGINLPRSARQQFVLGENIDKDSLDIGDLVFFRTYASFPSHVGIYIGNNLFIHASPRSKKVVIDSLDTPYFLKRYIGAKRLIEEAIKEPEKLLMEMSSSTAEKIH